jgi:phage terminase large subunit-like protein
MPGTLWSKASGILAISPDSTRPEFEPSKRRLTWKNGAIATLFSSEEPERLRGPQFGAAWCDELAAWSNANATWDMLQFCMRLGKDPRAMVTTTPKPIPPLLQLWKRDDVAITRGSTTTTVSTSRQRTFPGSGREIRRAVAAGTVRAIGCPNLRWLFGFRRLRSPQRRNASVVEAEH